MKYKEFSRRIENCFLKIKEEVKEQFRIKLGINQTTIQSLRKEMELHNEQQYHQN